LKRSGCELALEEPLSSVERLDHGFQLSTPRRTFTADRLLITTGGQSYPGCGTTGDGYRWLAQLGHTIVPPRPALVPITTSAPWVPSLSGVTIPDTGLRLIQPGDKPKVLDRRRGSLLFTHFGLSGPVALDISRHVSGHQRPQSLRLECDFLPTESMAALEERLKRQASTEGRKQVLALIPDSVPRRLSEILLREAGLAPDHKAAELSNERRKALAKAIKESPVPVTGTRGFAKAEVTAGGVSLDEIDSSTMQSKLVPGLYLAGEVLDLDGPIGGYNFQAAFSTGWLAGLNA
jgi:predicted Rossmann fold flavoprotein